MTDDALDPLDFDDLVALALAHGADPDPADGPSPEVRVRLLARIGAEAPPLPPGFSLSLASDAGWLPHPVPGIRMKKLSESRKGGYVTLLLDVAPGTHFPAHHHTGDEECYVISGSVRTCGRHLGPGDFIHADSDTDHGELVSDEGCRVLLVVPLED
jgi:quercetin dioxygenase-like cupin family protein